MVFSSVLQPVPATWDTAGTRDRVAQIIQAFRAALPALGAGSVSAAAEFATSMA